MKRNPDYDAVIAEHLIAVGNGGSLIRLDEDPDDYFAYGVCFQARSALPWRHFGAISPVSLLGTEQSVLIPIISKMRSYSDALVHEAFVAFGYPAERRRDPLGDFDRQPTSERWVGERGERRRELALRMGQWIKETSQQGT